MTAKKKATRRRAPKAAGKSAADAMVEAYLIEHGGAPQLTTTNEDDGSSVTAPQFPSPLPSLGQAMKAYPCEGHGDRDPAICRIAKRAAR